MAAAEAAGREAGDSTACGAVPEPGACCGPQPATMIAAASNAARPPLVTAAVATRCTGASRVAGMTAILASWLDEPLAVVGEGLQDVVGGLGPGERPGVLVPLVDPLADVGFEVGDAAVG